MNKLMTISAIALTLFSAAGLAADNDSRQLVQLPPMMRDHMLANMRDHLVAITEIHTALSEGKFDQAADIAEKRIGMSSLTSHSAEHMAPHMPKKMQEIGTQMHRTASRFAIVAQEAAVDGNAMRAIGALAQITQQCVACHSSFRAH